LETDAVAKLLDCPDAVVVTKNGKRSAETLVLGSHKAQADQQTKRVPLELRHSLPFATGEFETFPKFTAINVLMDKFKRL